MIGDARLGLRLAGAGGRSGLARLALMASGSAAAAFVVLTSVGLAGVADRQESREQRITPVVADSTQAPSEANARLISDGWDGRELLRVVLASDRRSTPVPPGVDRLPEPGEVLLSPALARLTDTEPLVAARFAQQQGPVIEPDGLVAPDQLLAYVGTTADQLGPFSQTIVGFGDPTAVGRIDPRAARTIGLLVTLMLVAPVVMFMTVCARLSANARSQRLAALRLVGLSAGRTQIVNAAEAATAAVAGTVLGFGCWLGWRAVRPTAQIGVFGWYSSDLHVPATSVAAVLVALAAIAVATGAVAATPGINHPLRVRRDRSTRRLSPWRVVPLLLGVVILAVSRATATTGGTAAQFVSWTMLFGAGLLLTIVGLVLAAPYAAVAFGALLARSRRPALLLAGGRLRHEPAASSRLVAAVAIALFAAGIGQVVATSLALTIDEDDPSLPPAVNLEVVGPETRPASYEKLTALGVALPAVRVGSAGQEIDAVVATCAQLRIAVSAGLPGCIDDRILAVEGPELSTGPESDPAEQDGALGDAMAAAGLPAASGRITIVIPFVDGFFSPAAVIPPGLSPPTATRFYVPVPAADYDPQRLTAELADRSPTAEWNPAITQVDRLDTPRIYRGLIAVGSVAGLAIGLAALLVATVATAIERRLPLAHLTALGAPMATIRRAVIVQTAPVSLLLLMLAAIAAVIGGDAYIRWGHPGEALPLIALATLLLGGVGITIVASLAAALTSIPAGRAEVLRQE